MKIGDAVKIIDAQDIPTMQNLIGTIQHIVSGSENGWKLSSNDGYSWIDKWLEVVDEAATNLFSVGDKIRVRTEFWKTRCHGDPGLNDMMRDMAGTEYTIKTVWKIENNEWRYRLEEDEYGWVWAEYWLEPAEEFKDISDVNVMYILGE